MNEPFDDRRSEFGYLLLAALFLGALIACNLVAQKFVYVQLPLRDAPFVLSAGVLPYPLTFLVTDVLSEIYGRRRANQVVAVGFFASLLVLGIVYLGAVFPAIPGSPVDDATYQTVFQNAWRVIFASMVAYLVAQLVDIRLFHFWRRLTNGRHLWLRNNASTILSQLVDTVLVIGVLFVGERSFAEMGAMVADGWMFKALCALADTPFCYLAVWLFRRHGLAPPPDPLPAPLSP